MAGQTADLEARLRVLRNSKRPPATATAPLLVSSIARKFTGFFSNSSPVRNEIPMDQPVSDAAGSRYQSARCSSSVYSSSQTVKMINCRSSDYSTRSVSSSTSMASRNVSQATRAHAEVLQFTAAQLLGSDYEEAVKIAQYAIDRERRQLPHTAIDAYIQAGQMLIEIGRGQSASHLQNIVKEKALALLQRAERLSEWTNEVLAKDLSQQALAEAYCQLQQNRNKSLTKKKELVLKMQQNNRNVKERLNQLALMTKIRGRLIKVVRTRRAQKAAEAEKKKKEVEIDAEAVPQAARGTASASISTSFGIHNVPGDIDDSGNEDRGDSLGGPNNAKGFSSDEDEEPRVFYRHRRDHRGSATRSLPQETQKVGLINELHERIGLPRISQFRKFEPLTHDTTTDKKQEQLQSELEMAKEEADKLRVAVQEMERCLQLAVQHSKQRSIEWEQQKVQEFATLQRELDRLREELEAERQQSSSLCSSSSSLQSLVISDGNEEIEKETEVMEHLRSSLYKVLCGRNEQPDGDDDDDDGYNCRQSVQHMSPSQDCCPNTPKSKEHGLIAQSYATNEEGLEADDDGGIWL